MNEIKIGFSALKKMTIGEIINLDKKISNPQSSKEDCCKMDASSREGGE